MPRRPQRSARLTMRSGLRAPSIGHRSCSRDLPRRPRSGPRLTSASLGIQVSRPWSAALAIQWRIFDGGARKGEVAKAESKKRESQDEMRDKRDKATREVWTAYIGFRTALRKQQAAVALLDSANASYSASLDAYKYGVKNLIDVVTAERQLAQARLSSVSARSQLFLEAVDLEFVNRQPFADRPRARLRQPRPQLLWFRRHLRLEPRLHLLLLRLRTVDHDEKNIISLARNRRSLPAVQRLRSCTGHRCDRLVFSCVDGLSHHRHRAHVGVARGSFASPA